MKLPGSLIKKRTDEIAKRSISTIAPVVVEQKKDNAPLPSPIQSPVSMSAAPAEIQFVDNNPEDLKKIAPPAVVDMLMNKLEQLEKRQSPEKVVTPPPIVDVLVHEKSDVTPVVETTTVKPELTETYLSKLSKSELMSICSTNKVYVKLPATRKVLIAAILKKQNS